MGLASRTRKDFYLTAHWNGPLAYRTFIRAYALHLNVEPARPGSEKVGGINQRGAARTSGTARELELNCTRTVTELPESLPSTAPSTVPDP